jgi:hypothetical protein
MLLNLDLFRSRPQQGEPEGEGLNAGESTLDQIRTLNALGYLGNRNGVDVGAGGAANRGLEQYTPPPSQENAE